MIVLLLAPRADDFFPNNRFWRPPCAWRLRGAERASVCTPDISGSWEESYELGRGLCQQDIGSNWVDQENRIRC